MNHQEVSESLKVLLGITIALYIVAMFVLAHFAHQRVHNTEDYIVAGRRLPIFLAASTLVATWFGAGTILTVCTEVSRHGVQRAALDPLGSGMCLIIAGFFFARPLWDMGLLTLCDFFRRRFGVRTEVISAVLMVPSYFGWIAAQFVALAQVFNLFFDLPVSIGVLLIALFGTGYTLLGGMWSVTLTDSVQITLVIIGLVVLTLNVLTGIGHGDAISGYWSVINSVQQTSPEKLQWIPTETAAKFWGWMSILCAGALGNIPGQDLMQRVFASKSATVAKHACWLAGVVYIIFGMLPVLLGLVAATYFKDRVTDTVLPALAQAFLHPVMAVIFVVVIMSAVLSTVTSSILSPATVLAQNLLSKLSFIKMDGLTLNRWCVVIIAAGSLAMSYSGQGAFSLLENAYSLTMVGLFVPLVMGLYTRPRNEVPALAGMLVGTGIWLPQYVLGWEHFLEAVPPFDQIGLSLSLTATGASFVAYLAVHLVQSRLLKMESQQEDLFKKTAKTSTEPDVRNEAEITSDPEITNEPEEQSQDRCAPTQHSEEGQAEAQYLNGTTQETTYTQIE